VRYGLSVPLQLWASEKESLMFKEKSLKQLAVNNLGRHIQSNLNSE
jgi:hypothetical protein